MKSNYVCLNSKTFEIEKRQDIIPVDEQLAKTISILNKKGYLIEMFNRAKISKPFLVGAMLHDLIKEGLLDINDQTKNVIKKVVRESNYESTLIVFKKDYNFDILPSGFKMIGKDLFYNLNILKDSDEIELKTLLELDNEHNESIKNLEKWAIKLPRREENMK